MIVKIAKIIASGFYSGYAPIAPGTFGSLFGVILVYFINSILLRFGVEGNVFIISNILMVVISYFLGVWAVKKVHDIWKHDDGRIVIDEIVGVWLGLIFIPVDVKYYLLAFVVFRFFDILKPFGIKKIDQLGGDSSVMLDDVLAGIYSMIVVIVTIRYF